MLHAICDRIVVAGRSIVAARLTPAAYANGLASAPPQAVMARPEGVGRTPPAIEIQGVEAGTMTWSDGPRTLTKMVDGP
ncbi:MAG: hypothetical protein ACYC65_01800 [Candidatus Limnocylindrales bacterium]